MSYGTDRDDVVLPPFQVEMPEDAAAERDCLDTLTPLIDRASRACDSLRQACLEAGPSEKMLRETLGEVRTLIERADYLAKIESTVGSGVHTGVSGTDAATVTELEELRLYVSDAVATLREDVDGEIAAQRRDVENVRRELVGKIREAASSARLDAISAGDSFAGESVPAGVPTGVSEAIAQEISNTLAATLGAWERETAELMTVFRDRIERAIGSIESVAGERVRDIEVLCGRAERIFAESGTDAGSMAQMVGELVESVKPLRGLLVEGKCGPDMQPLIASIVEQVKADIRGEIERLDATVAKIAATPSIAAQPVIVPRAVTTVLTTTQGRKTMTSAAVGSKPAEPAVRPAVRPAGKATAKIAAGKSETAKTVVKSRAAARSKAA